MSHPLTPRPPRRPSPYGDIFEARRAADLVRAHADARGGRGLVRPSARQYFPAIETDQVRTIGSDGSASNDYAEAYADGTPLAKRGLLRFTSPINARYLMEASGSSDLQVHIALVGIEANGKRVGYAGMRGILTPNPDLSTVTWANQGDLSYGGIATSGHPPGPGMLDFNTSSATPQVANIAVPCLGFIFAGLSDAVELHGLQILFEDELLLPANTVVRLRTTGALVQ